MNERAYERAVVCDTLINCPKATSQTRKTLAEMPLVS